MSANGKLALWRVVQRCVLKIDPGLRRDDGHCGYDNDQSTLAPSSSRRRPGSIFTGYVRRFELHLALWLTLSLLSACGFHLRGPLSAALPFQKVYIQGAGNDGTLVQMLRAALEQSSVIVVASADQAQVVVSLSEVMLDRRVLAVGTAGGVEEYELQYQVDMTPKSPDGKVLQETDNVDLSTDYQYDDTALLAKSEEQEQHINDMRESAVREMLRHLQRVKFPTKTSP